MKLSFILFVVKFFCILFNHGNAPICFYLFDEIDITLCASEQWFSKCEVPEHLGATSKLASLCNVKKMDHVVTDTVREEVESGARKQRKYDNELSEKAIKALIPFSKYEVNTKLA